MRLQSWMAASVSCSLGSKEDIGCDHKGCRLRSAIIVPINQENRVIGALKLYKAEDRAITMVETELALGLAQLFSTQLELSRVDHQRELLAKSLQCNQYNSILYKDTA